MRGWTTKLGSPGTSIDTVEADLSADGRYLLTNTTLASGAKLTLVDLATGATQVVANVAYQLCDLPEDGRYVAYATYNSASTVASLHLWDRTTGTSGILVPTPNTGLYDEQQYLPQISPDDSKVYFESADQGLIGGNFTGDQRDLYQIDLNTGPIVRLHENVTGVDPHDLQITAGDDLRRGAAAHY